MDSKTLQARSAWLCIVYSTSLSCMGCIHLAFSDASFCLGLIKGLCPKVWGIRSIHLSSKWQWETLDLIFFRMPIQCIYIKVQLQPIEMHNSYIPEVVLTIGTGQCWERGCHAPLPKILLSPRRLGAENEHQIKMIVGVSSVSAATSQSGSSLANWKTSWIVQYWCRARSHSLFQYVWALCVSFS